MLQNEKGRTKGMGFWIFMVIMNLMIPLMMIVFGKIFLKNPPKEINGVYGYRTGRSMKNKDTWDFAHRYFGRLWLQGGLILLPVSLMIMLFVLGKNQNIVGTVGGILCFLQMVPLIGAIFPTEKALKKEFDKEGRKR